MLIPSPRIAAWMRSATRRSRSGTTTIEVVVAITLLTTAAVGVSSFAASSRAGLRQRELSARIAVELDNAREIIGAWQPTDVTVDNIEQLSFSDSFPASYQPRWIADVETIDTPVPAVRVRLLLELTIGQQVARPDALTFWIDAQELAQ